MKPALSPIALKLLTARSRLGISQAETAKRAGVDVMTVSGCELGKTNPTPKTLARLYGVYQSVMTESLEDLIRLAAAPRPQRNGNPSADRGEGTPEDPSSESTTSDAE